jgi:hypothetical protein
VPAVSPTRALVSRERLPCRAVRVRCAVRCALRCPIGRASPACRFPPPLPPPPPAPLPAQPAVCARLAWRVGGKRWRGHRTALGGSAVLFFCAVVRRVTRHVAPTPHALPVTADHRVEAAADGRALPVLRIESCSGNGQHSVQTAQRANRQRAADNMQHATDNMQQTATRPPETTENGRREKKGARSPQHEATNHAAARGSMQRHFMFAAPAAQWASTCRSRRQDAAVGRPNGWTSRTGSWATSATAARNFSVKSLWSKDDVEATQRRG